MSQLNLNRCCASPRNLGLLSSLVRRKRLDEKPLVLLSPSERTIRVALVDDHPVFRAGLKQLFEEEGDIEVVHEGKTGSDAVEIAARGDVDVVLLDLAMPGLSGLEALREVRKIAPDLFVLVVSGYAQEHYGKRMIDRGADGYVSKISPPEELVAAVRCVVTGQRHVAPVVASQFAAWWTGSYECPVAGLSEREYEVLLRLASGLTVQAAAKALRVSRKTISAHRQQVLRKLKLSSDSDLTLFALKHDLICPELLFR